jgi:hypothetical protein
MTRSILKSVALAVFLAAGAAPALAQGNAITYQGQLKADGSAVNSPTDLRFSLFNAATGGTQVGFIVTQNAVDVADGLFTTPIDFGVNPYTSNQNLFLQIEVRNPAGSGSFVPMGSRQALTPAPFSLATRGLNVDAGGNISLSRSANRFLNVAQEPQNVPGGSNGKSLTLAAGSAANANSFASLGGNLILQAGSGFNATQPNVPGGDTIIRSGANAISAIDGRNGGSIILQSGAQNNTFVERMRVTPTGNVGIGTDSPSNRLSVSGNADVTGNVGINAAPTLSKVTIATDNAPFPAPGISVNPTHATSRQTSIAVGNWATVQDFNGTGGLNFSIYQRDVDQQRMFFSTTGNVGIGTTDPAARLHNVGTTRLDDQLQFGVQNFTGTTGSNARIYRFGTGGNVSNLYLDMTSSAPGSSFIFQANGNDRFSFDLSNGTALKTGGGAWGVLSDERTKTDIQPMTGTLDKLLKLKGHAYTYKSEFVEDGRALPGTQIGLVAQEVETVFPDWVTIGADGLKQVTERSTTALMVEALRDLRAEKDAEIATKDAQIATLEQRLARIEALLNAAAPQQK